MISGHGQHGLANQLAVRSELCRRLEGPVLAYFESSPVCLPDASYWWFELRWPAIADGEPEPLRAMSREAFEQAIRTRKPDLIIWGGRFAPPAPLSAWTEAILSCCYTIHDGFALRRDRHLEPHTCST
jgi:hypothetical protein